MNSAQEYRDRAAKAWRMAAEITDDNLREQIELIARDYEDLAATQTEHRPPPQPKPRKGKDST